MSEELIDELKQIYVKLDRVSELAESERLLGIDQWASDTMGDVQNHIDTVREVR